MRLPDDVIVERNKLVNYLLVHRPADDKSGFLRAAGFVRSNPDRLDAAIRELALTAESYEDGENEYGVFWRTEGVLRGPLADVQVVLIWLNCFAAGSFRFVTLKPKRSD